MLAADNANVMFFSSSEAEVYTFALPYTKNLFNLHDFCGSGADLQMFCNSCQVLPSASQASTRLTCPCARL